MVGWLFWNDGLFILQYILEIPNGKQYLFAQVLCMHPPFVALLLSYLLRVSPCNALLVILFSRLLFSASYSPLRLNLRWPPAEPFLDESDVGLDFCQGIKRIGSRSDRDRTPP